MFKVLRRAGLTDIYTIRYPDGVEKLATLNLVPGIRAYNEKVVDYEGREYRLWSPYRSKLAAAILNGMNVSFLDTVSRLLYLGSSTGTTVSHLSDILGLRGRIFAVEFSSRAMRQFIERVVKNRPNVLPIFGNARHPLKYRDLVGEVEAVYTDVAQRDQTSIAIENCSMFLRRGETLFLNVKARSIDVTRKPQQIYKEEEEKLIVKGYEIKHVIDLEPYEKDHAMLIAKKPRNPVEMERS